MDHKIISLSPGRIISVLDTTTAEIIPQLHICIADDEQNIRENLEKIVRSSFPAEINDKLTIHQAANGKEVLTATKTTPFNIILLDYFMPLMDGIATAKNLRQGDGFPLNSRTPIFYITGADESVIQKIERIENSDDDEVLHKANLNEAEVRRLVKREIKRQIERFRLEFKASIKQLIAEDEKQAKIRNLRLFTSPFTDSHNYRVKIGAPVLSDSSLLGFSSLERIIVERGLTEHDEGKLAIPRVILEFKGRLTDEKYALVKQHPMITPQITPIDRTECFAPNVVVDKYHHERFNGGGYVSGRPTAQENTITIQTPQGAGQVRFNHILRCASLIDAWDSISSSRPYKGEGDLLLLSSELVRHSYTQFDPLFVHAGFERLNTLYPLFAGPSRWSPELNFIKHFYEFIFTALRSSPLHTTILEYIAQDLDPADEHHTQKMLDAAGYLNQKVVLPFYIDQIQGGVPQARTMLKERYRAIYPQYLDAFTGRSSRFMLQYVFCEEGWAFNLLDASDIDLITMQVMQDVNKLPDMKDRLPRITAINDAQELLFLLGTLYEAFSKDHAASDDLPRLRGIYTWIQGMLETLQHWRTDAWIHQESSILKTMDHFNGHLTALFERIRSVKPSNVTSDSFMDDEVRRIIEQTSSFFKEHI